jgi:hypothetical protein
MPRTPSSPLSSPETPSRERLSPYPSPRPSSPRKRGRQNQRHDRVNSRGTRNQLARRGEHEDNAIIISSDEEDATADSPDEAPLPSTPHRNSNHVMPRASPEDNPITISSDEEDGIAEETPMPSTPQRNSNHGPPRVLPPSGSRAVSLPNPLFIICHIADISCLVAKERGR